MKKLYLIICIMITISSCNSKNNDQPNPLELSDSTLDSLVGNEIPWDKYAKWGTPETLDGTDNQFWVFYLDKANISLVSNKNNEQVLFVGRGKDAAIDHRKDNL